MRGPIAFREYSALFYAECGLFPGPALVKICLKARTHERDRAAAQRQYDALVTAHRAMASISGFCVPRPYLILREAALLAMEWVGGFNLAKELFSWDRRPDEAEAHVARSAGWLRAFHGCGRLAPGHLDVESCLPFLDELSGAVPDEAFHAGLKQLRRCADAARAVALPRAWIHGDFTPDNLIFSGPRTIGIDLHLQHENAVVYDLAPFLNHLALGLCEPAGWRLAPSHARLRNAFLDAYFQGTKDGIDKPLAWVQLYLALQQWRSARRLRHPLLRRLLDFQHRRLALDLFGRLAP